MWKPIDYDKTKLNEMIDMTIENYGLEESISNIDFIQREYFENPSGDAIIKLAEDEEKSILAGQYVINPHRFMFFGEEINTVLSLNTLTREAYRGQRIFTGLADLAYKQAEEEGFKFCYGAPNPNSHPGFIKKLGFIDLIEMPLYVRPLKFSQIMKERGKKILSVLFTPLNLFVNPKRVNDDNIQKITSSNYQIIDAFWEKVSNKYNIIGIRNSEYIKYRYLDVPTREYHPYVYFVNNEPVAFIVSRIRYVAKMKTGMIADFLYVPGFEKQAKKLVKYMNRKLKDLGAGLAGCIMMSHSQEAKMLKKGRFVKCPDKLLPQPTPLILRVFDKELEKKGIFNSRNWFFTTGDYDVV